MLSKGVHIRREEKEAEGERSEGLRAIAIEATYNDYLLEKIQEMFSREESAAFLVASDKQRPLTLRVNSLMEKRSNVMNRLSVRGVSAEAIDWCEDAAVVYHSSVPIGATPEYLAGMYILQSPSSLLPVMALDPQEGDKVVDLCAAPGGKTSHIAAIMKNTGVIYANDVSRERIAALFSNLQRMGVINTICSSMCGLKFPEVAPNRVLVDAPCSGTGVISKDPAAKRNKTESSIRSITAMQKALILKGFDMLKKKGKGEGRSVLVYSTCSILVEENEKVVQYLLTKRKNAKVVDSGLPIGREGFSSYRGAHFHPSLKLTRRFYPHVHNTDGFFVARIEKE